MERVELTDDDDDGLVACALPNFPNVVFGDDELPMTPEKRGTVRKRGLQSFEVSYIGSEDENDDCVSLSAPVPDAPPPPSPPSCNWSADDELAQDLNAPRPKRSRHTRK